MSYLSQKALSCDSVGMSVRGFEYWIAYNYRSSYYTISNAQIMFGRSHSPIKDPIFNTSPRVLSFVFRLIPIILDLSNQAVLVGGGGILGLNTLQLQVGGELARVPVAVWLGDPGLPVVLDKILEVLAVCWCRVRDVVVRQPSLKFGFVPFVINCRKRCQKIAETCGSM
jgi:hypothetical protein